MAEAKHAAASNVVPIASRQRFGQKPSIFESDDWRDHVFDFDDPPVPGDWDAYIPIPQPDAPPVEKRPSAPRAGRLLSVQFSLPLLAFPAAMLVLGAWVFFYY